ncbi:MAG: hypothetical protein EOO43_12000, partial [Flavobacterium sp.]
MLINICYLLMSGFKSNSFATIGQIGTMLLIAVGFLAYVIWRFNPVFQLPQKKAALAPEPVTADEAEAAEDYNENDDLDDEEEEEVSVVTANALKGNAGMMNDVPDQSPQFNHELTIVEREAEPIAAPVKPAKKVEAPLPLTVAPLPEEVIAAPVVIQ